jgi:hypothetical protein
MRGRRLLSIDRDARPPIVGRGYLVAKLMAPSHSAGGSVLA